MYFSQNDLNGIGDLKSIYRWRVVFNLGHGDTDGLELRCSSVTLPKRTHEPMENELHGHTFKRPGQVKSDGTISLTFLEDVNNIIISAFREMENDLWTADSTTNDEKGVQKSWEDIKGSVTITLQDSQDNDLDVYELRDCQIGSFDPGGDLGSDNDSFKPTVEINYNWFNWSN